MSVRNKMVVKDIESKPYVNRGKSRWLIVIPRSNSEYRGALR